MGDRCPHCGQVVEGPSTLDRISAWCEANGRHVTADGSVYEDTAALILERAEGTLANWRLNGGAGVAVRRFNGGRVRYRLSDLAAHLDKKQSHEGPRLTGGPSR